MNIFFSLTSFLFKLFFTVFYHYCVYGTKPIYPGAAIIAPNHLSFLDPPLMGASWPEETHFLAKASLFSSPLLRIILTHLNTHPVQGSAQDLASFKIICRLLNENKKVVIFPEGMRSENGQLRPIKTGVAMLALRTKSPIIPTYIYGTFEAWPRDRKWPKLGGKIACVFGKPILVDPYLQLEKKKAQEMLTQQLQQSIVNLKEWFEKGAVGEPPA
jgi:1-acyl-sn-glycerol-3-phosphate acyltransferase